MSQSTENYADGSEYEPDAPTQQQDPREIQSLRKAAEKGRKLERENAFLRAGVDVDNPRNSYFIKGYEGELTPDAIKAAGIEAGFIEAPAPDPAVQQHQQGQAQVQAASAGTEAVYDPMGAVYDMEKAFAEGGVDAMIAAGTPHGLKVARPQ